MRLRLSDTAIQGHSGSAQDADGAAGQHDPEDLRSDFRLERLKPPLAVAAAATVRSEVVVEVEVQLDGPHRLRAGEDLSDGCLHAQGLPSANLIV